MLSHTAPLFCGIARRLAVRTPGWAGFLDARGVASPRNVMAWSLQNLPHDIQWLSLAIELSLLDVKLSPFNLWAK